MTTKDAAFVLCFLCLTGMIMLFLSACVEADVKKKCFEIAKTVEMIVECKK